MRVVARRRPAVSALALVLASLLASGARRVQASGQSNSGTGSGGDSSNSKDSNSSNGSGDSSNSSKGSSDNSRASSKDSNNSTQNSPKNSSDYTTHHSSDWTTKTRDGHIFSVAFVLVSVGATVLGIVAAKGTQRANQQQMVTALAEFMRSQHPLLTHDVSLATGPVLRAWSRDLRLSADEHLRLEQALEGSAEQGVLLEALDGAIDETRARAFSAAFLRVAGRALGAARTKALVERAVVATGTG